MLKDNLKITGKVSICLRDKNGKIKDRTVIDNLVVNTGLYHIADQLSGKIQAEMSHLAIGTGTTPATATDTILSPQLTGIEISRKAFDSKDQGTGGDANKIVYIASWGDGEGEGAITEAGIFNASGGGVMLCRTTFPVKNKGAGDSLTLTWTLSINA